MAWYSAWRTPHATEAGMQLSRKAVLALTTSVLVLTSASFTNFSLLLHPIEVDFGWARATATLPYMVAMVTWGISSPFFGKLADDHGVRPVMLSGIVIMATGFLGMALAQNLWQLTLAFGVLVGASVGAAGIGMGALLVSKHFDARNRGWAVSVVQTASPLYPLLFAPLLFLLIKAFGWRSAALVSSGLLWFVALPIAWVGTRDPDTTRVAHYRRAPWSAVLPFLRNRSMLALCVARFSCGLAFFYTAHMVTLAMNKGLDAVVGTAALSVYGAAAVAWSLLFGWLADRHGRAHMLALSYAVRGLGSLVMATVVPNELLFYVLVAVGIGPTFGTIAVQNVLFYEAAGPRLAGLILGLSFIIHQLGSAIGPQLGSIVYDQTNTYDGYLFAIGVVLLGSAVITFNIKDIGSRMPEPAEPAVSTAPSPAPAGARG
jgi:MFS family permease